MYYIFKFLATIFGYNFSLWFNSLRNYLLSISLSTKLDKGQDLARFQYPIKIQGFKNIKIGKNFSSGKNFRIQAISKYCGFEYSPKIVIGDNVTINPNCQIVAVNKISIGNNVLLASNVFISDHSHGRIKFDDIETAPALRILESKGTISIGDNVWVGQNVSILPNVSIGRNAIVGANSVVTKDIPDYSIAVGIPAKVIKILTKN
jgi:acetyltransferase-like isoleucine patch superfamily enzyme